jgi:beta-mannosidase
VEHWRRRKYRTAGTLFWQLNDCWPVSSWAVIDSSLVPKAAYYFSKKFYAPILLSFKSEGESIDVWLTNDANRSLNGTVVIELRSMNGSVKWKRSKRLECAGDASYAAAKVLLTAIDAYDPAEHYLHARLETIKGVVAENRYFFKEPKHLHLPNVKIKWKIAGLPAGGFLLSVSASKFAKNVRLEIASGAAEFSDNYFDLDGGDTRKISVKTDRTIAWVKKHLSVSRLQ